MTRAAENALTLALIKSGLMDFITAEDFASSFFGENADLFSASAAIKQVSAATGWQPNPKPVFPECPNCHEPENDHMPNCARATGMDPRAVSPKYHAKVGPQ